MPPKVSGPRCGLCNDAALSDTPAGGTRVVVRRATVSVFWCAHCNNVARDGWHPACVARRMKLSADGEIGLTCRHCSKLTVVRRESGYFAWLARLVWARHLDIGLWAPWYVAFAFNRAQDFLACCIGFMTIVLLRAVMPYEDVNAPGVMQHIIDHDIPLQFENLRQTALRYDELSVASLASTYIVGWVVISVWLSFCCGFCCFHRRWRRQKSRGLVVDAPFGFWM